MNNIPYIILLVAFIIMTTAFLNQKNAWETEHKAFTACMEKLEYGGVQ